MGAILIGISKVFSCIPHDLLIAKLTAYGFVLNAFTFIFKYLKNQKQSVGINNTRSSYKNIISGEPEGSVGLIILNIEKSSMFNFADDNTLSAFAKTMGGLLHILQSESLKSSNGSRKIK